MFATHIKTWGFVNHYHTKYLLYANPHSFAYHKLILAMQIKCNKKSYRKAELKSIIYFNDILLQESQIEKNVLSNDILKIFLRIIFQRILLMTN